MKNTFKFKLLFIGVFVLLFNCGKEQTVEHHHELIEETKTTEFKRISVSDLMKNDKTFTKLSENYLSDKMSSKGSFAKSTSSDFIITSDTINVVEKENYKSYTIRIKRENKLFDTEKYINPIANALREVDDYRYPQDYYKSFAWDANNLLSMEMDNIYNDYRSTVIQNTTLCD